MEYHKCAYMCSRPRRHKCSKKATYKVKERVLSFLVTGDRNNPTIIYYCTQHLKVMTNDILARICMTDSKYQRTGWIKDA